MDGRVMSLRFSTVAILLFVGLLSGPTEGRRLVKITNFQCKSLDENFGYFNSCYVKAVKRDWSELNFHFVLNTIVKGNITLNFYVKKRGNVRSPTVYNLTFDVCKFMENRNKFPLFNIIYKLIGLEEYSNVNHTCPYEKEVILKDYRYSDKYINMIPVPLGQYWMSMNWSYFRKLVLRYEIAFEFFEKFDYINRRIGAKNP